MTPLATRLHPGSDVVGPGGTVVSAADLAALGTQSPMGQARVAVALRDPLALVRALVALDGQVAALLLLSGQAPAEVIETLVSRQDVTHLLTDRADLAGHALALSPEALFGAQRAATPQRTHWLMTTSGTTGLPKVIPHTLASLSRTVVKMRESPLPVWGMLYDGTRFAGMQLLLQGLIGGGRLVLVDTHQGLADQVSAMAGQGVTHLSATPTLWRRLLMVPGHRDLALRQITLGGEIADQGILTKLRAAYPQARVTHIYAATETGVGFAVNDGLAGFPEAFLTKAPGGIGVKVSGGILWLRPPGLTEHRPSIAPTIEQDAEGYLSTGDQVEIREGRVFFLGRDSGVINIGGVKVYPERVEAVISAVPGVTLAQVGSKTSPFTGALVTATVMAAEGADRPALKAAIQAACRAQLEREAVPASVRFVEDLEINAAGKIVRASKTAQDTNKT